MNKNTKAELVAASNAARDLARQNPTPENRQAAVAASKALSEWITANDPPKSSGYASRAGKRQAAERRRRS